MLSTVSKLIRKSYQLESNLEARTLYGTLTTSNHAASSWEIIEVKNIRQEVKPARARMRKEES